MQGPSELGIAEGVSTLQRKGCQNSALPRALALCNAKDASTSQSEGRLNSGQ